MKPGVSLASTTVLPALDAATQHLAVETQHRVQIGHAQHEMVDFADAEHGATP